MNKSILTFLVCISTLYLSPLANAEDELSAQGIMAISKAAGACGILNSMLYFQKSTQMPEGDKFIVRFWTAEAARLGESIEKYSEKCNKAIASYNKLWNALDETNQ